MSIVFYKQLDKKFDGSPIEREYYTFRSGPKRRELDGSIVYEKDISGLVDDAIRAAHPKEYAEFLAQQDVDVKVEVAVEPEAPASLPEPEAPAVEPVVEPGEE